MGYLDLSGLFKNVRSSSIKSFFNSKSQCIETSKNAKALESSIWMWVLPHEKKNVGGDGSHHDPTGPHWDAHPLAIRSPERTGVRPGNFRVKFLPWEQGRWGFWIMGYKMGPGDLRRIWDGFLNALFFPGIFRGTWLMNSEHKSNQSKSLRRIGTRNVCLSVAKRDFIWSLWSMNIHFRPFRKRVDVEQQTDSLGSLDSLHHLSGKKYAKSDGKSWLKQF